MRFINILLHWKFRWKSIFWFNIIGSINNGWSKFHRSHWLSHSSLAVYTYLYRLYAHKKNALQNKKSFQQVKRHNFVSGNMSHSQHCEASFPGVGFNAIILKYTRITNKWNQRILCNSNKQKMWHRETFFTFSR